MSEQKLLSCPLCGGEASIEHDYDYASHPWYYVECDKCGCKTETHVDENGKEQAIKEWNTRKPMERIVERLEEASFPHKIGGEIQLTVLKKRIDEIFKEEGM